MSDTTEPEPVERWLAVAGYEGLYEVSDLGRVRSLDRIVMHGTTPHHRHGVMLRPGRLASGRLAVCLNHGSGNRRSALVHQLVATAFVPGKAPGLEVCHRDDVKDNNVASNLRWDTKSENMRDRRRNGIDPNVNKTHCRRNHPYSEENTYVNPRNGSRTCRICREQTAIRYRRRKGAPERIFLGRGSVGDGGTPSREYHWAGEKAA